MAAGTALVFDDDIFFRNFLTETLASLHLEVTTFSSHASFLSRINAECGLGDATPCPDFILTDNQMPGMTGLEFVKRIKLMGCKIPNQNIAIISGRWTEEELDAANQLGCKVFQKYNSPDQIRAWIEEAEKRI